MVGKVVLVACMEIPWAIEAQQNKRVDVLLKIRWQTNKQMELGI